MRILAVAALLIIAAGCGGDVSPTQPSPMPASGAGTEGTPTPGFGAIEGRVTDAETGNALAGVRVDATNGTTSFSVTTSTVGAFRMDLPPGVARVTATKEGYVTYDREHTIQAGPMTLQISLAKIVIPPPLPQPTCKFDVAPAAQSIGVLTGSGSVVVATTRECTWTATTDVGWITLTPPTSGSGNGTVNFAVAGNTSIGASERTGSVIIAGQRSTITQGGGTTCSYTIDPGSQTIGAAGGAGAPVGVSTNGCRWTATSNVPWITVTAGASGVGNGVVAFSVAANTGAARTGTLTIAGRTATISQTAAGAPPPPPPPPPACPYTISPDTQGVSEIGGGGHTVAVTTAGTCAWTATSNDGWITIVTGASGTGNGRVTFTVARNDTGAGRRGTLTIAGRTATIIQGATGPLPH